METFVKEKVFGYFKKSASLFARAQVKRYHKLVER